MLDRGAKWLQLWSFLWGEFANVIGFLTMVEQKCLVEQKRSSKNNWSSKIGRAKIFGRAKMVEQKYLVEQIAAQTVPPNRPAGPSHGTAPCSKNIIKQLVSQHFVFARTNLLMNLLTQFGLFGRRHFRSPWGAILLVIWGGHHFGSPWGTIMGQRWVTSSYYSGSLLLE